MRHRELYRTKRIGWLRAPVLGANDGIVSTASLVVGVAAANTGRSQILLAGMAGLVAGALSMAAGEYVCVSSQGDTERADLGLERSELSTQRIAEENELAAIYERRGVEPTLARRVALQLMPMTPWARTPAMNLACRTRSLPTSAPGSTCISSNIRLGCSFADPDCYAGTAIRPGSYRLGCVVNMACFARRSRGAYRGRVRAYWRYARGVLGRPCDGRHGRRRSAVRNDSALSGDWDCSLL
jgi:hypothetical protein